jgi:hypothetical protein
MQLENRVAIITGGAQGIGKAIAIAFAVATPTPYCCTSAGFTTLVPLGPMPLICTITSSSLAPS